MTPGAAAVNLYGDHSVFIIWRGLEQDHIDGIDLPQLGSHLSMRVIMQE